MCFRCVAIECLREGREQVLHVPDLLGSFALPDKAVQLQLSYGKLWGNKLFRWFDRPFVPFAEVN